MVNGNILTIYYFKLNSILKKIMSMKTAGYTAVLLLLFEQAIHRFIILTRYNLLTVKPSCYHTREYCC